MNTELKSLHIGVTFIVQGKVLGRRRIMIAMPPFIPAMVEIDKVSLWLEPENIKLQWSTAPGVGTYARLPLGWAGATALVQLDCTLDVWEAVVSNPEWKEIR